MTLVKTGPLPSQTPIVQTLRMNRFKALLHFNGKDYRITALAAKMQGPLVWVLASALSGKPQPALHLPQGHVSEGRRMALVSPCAHFSPASQSTYIPSCTGVPVKETLTNTAGVNMQTSH